MNYQISMRRKNKPIDVNELIDADDINRTTIKGEMRKLWTAIHQKLTDCGWTARDMVKWLDERGVSMSVELFRVYLRDLDLEQGYDRSKNEFHRTNKNKPSNELHRVPKDNSSLGHLTCEKGKATEIVKKEVDVMHVSKSGGKRKSILNVDKGMFGDLDPPPADGIVNLKHKVNNLRRLV